MKKLFLIPIFTLLFLSVTAMASAQWVTTQLTDNTYTDQRVRINDSGHVAWEGNNGTDYEIFYYDGSTITQLTDNTGKDERAQINANGHVVWQAYDSTDFEWEIFYYDGTTVTQLTDNTRQDVYPQINANGHVVPTARCQDIILLS